MATVAAATLGHMSRCLYCDQQTQQPQQQMPRQSRCDRCVLQLCTKRAAGFMHKLNKDCLGAQQHEGSLKSLLTHSFVYLFKQPTTKQ